MSIHEGGSKTPSHFLWGIVFFIFVVIVTIVIFWYKHKVATENNNLTQQISELQTTLSTLRKDKDVQAYELYDKNRTQLDILTYNSQVPLFYNEISRLSRLYNFEFSNFSFNKWAIKLSALAKSDSSERWYEKFRSLITDFYNARYSDDDIDDESDNINVNFKSILDLKFVKWFQWSNNVASFLEFIIKPEEIKIEEVKEEDTIEKIDSQKTENALIEAAITQ